MILALGIVAKMSAANCNGKPDSTDVLERPDYSSRAASIDFNLRAAFRSFRFCVTDFF